MSMSNVKIKGKAARPATRKAGATSKPSKPGAPTTAGTPRTASKSAAKAQPAKKQAATPAKKRSRGVVLLSGGNPQIAKGDGDAPVQAYLAAIPGWKRDVARRIDALVVRTIPGVEKAVKWNSPFYGVAGQGWFLSFHVFTSYVKVTFFRGASLEPLPPGPSKDANTRYADIREGELDEAQMASWVKQAAALPGWMA
jgi:hypothetical protein